jgi:hypothetical protein
MHCKPLQLFVGFFWSAAEITCLLLLGLHRQRLCCSLSPLLATADLKKGTPPSQLIAKHQHAIFPFPEEGGASFHDSLGYWLKIVHRARVGAFAKMGRDPSFREVPVEEASRVAVSSPPSDSTDDRTWSFAEPQFVYGIRVRGYPLHALGRTITLS